MSSKHAAASKERWAKIAPEERSRRMSEAAKKRWAKEENKDPKTRRELALKMVEARKKHGN